MSNDNLAGVWTRKGLDKLAAQLAGGEAVTIKNIALGDGGGTVPPALESMTGLLGERWRGAVNTVEIDPDSENSVIVQAVIPYNVGGWFIREWGLYDAAGDLVAYGPHAEFYKPVLDSGSGAELLERIKLPISNQGPIKLVVCGQGGRQGRGDCGKPSQQQAGRMEYHLGNRGKRRACASGGAFLSARP